MKRFLGMAVAGLAAIALSTGLLVAQTGTESRWQDSVLKIFSLKIEPVNVGDVATYTVLANNSGRVHYIPNLTADLVLSLPTPAADLKYEFVYSGVAADAQDWQFDTGSNTNYYLGGLVHLDTDAGSAGDEVVPVAGDGNSNSRVNVLVPHVGTRVSLISDGTLWILNGQVVGATAPTYADQ